MAKRLSLFLSLSIVLLLFSSTEKLCAAANDSIVNRVAENPAKNSVLFASNTILYISNNAIIGITGDLTLENSMVLGHGKLVMKSNQNQTLQSKTSIISNLEIDNPNSVILLGDLAILENLTIKKGIFDISQGLLIINPENITLLDGGSLFKGNQAEVSTSYPESLLSNSMSLQMNFTPEYYLTGYFDALYKNISFTFREILYNDGLLSKAFQPPKEA